MQIYEELKKDKKIWELFTKQEEKKSLKTDKYGRYLSRFSKYNNLLYPSVSEYLIKKGHLHFEYPENKKFAVVLTHDIDDIKISNYHVLRSLIPFPPNRDFLGFIPILSERLKGNKSSYNNFKQILQLEEKYNAKSTFYFLTKNNDIFGDKYEIEDIREDICFILDNQFEIGLHTSYYAYNKLEEIKIEKEKLEKITGSKIKGVRNHLLRFSIPDSWEILSNAGFTYDTTLGYHDAIGFRNGMCHPFKPFNPVTNKQINILEIPLCISDVALFSFMKKNAKNSWEIIKKTIDAIERWGGVLTILWHNWAFSYPVSYAGLFGKEWIKLYEKILEYSNKKNGWLTSGINLSDFILKNI